MIKELAVPLVKMLITQKDDGFTDKASDVLAEMLSVNRTNLMEGTSQSAETWNRIAKTLCEFIQGARPARLFRCDPAYQMRKSSSFRRKRRSRSGSWAERRANKKKMKRKKQWNLPIVDPTAFLFRYEAVLSSGFPFGLGVRR